MIEIINREMISAKIEEIKKYCDLCKKKGSHTCRYCQLGPEKEVFWDESDDK